jgi:hypothetical protein
VHDNYDVETYGRSTWTTEETPAGRALQPLQPRLARPSTMDLPQAGGGNTLCLMASSQKPLLRNFGCKPCHAYFRAEALDLEHLLVLHSPSDSGMPAR